MERKFANPEALGFACLFIAGWLISLINAHWFLPPMNYSGVVLVMLLGGVILSIAGIFAYINGSTLDTALFLVIGALLFSFSLTSMVSTNSIQSGTLSSFAGWIYILYAVFISYLWFASFGENIGRNLFLFGLCLTFIALAIGNWTGSGGIEEIGGYLGLITSVLAGYVSASSLLGARTQRAHEPATSTVEAHAH